MNEELRSVENNDCNYLLKSRLQLIFVDKWCPMHWVLDPASNTGEGTDVITVDKKIIAVLTAWGQPF